MRPTKTANYFEQQFTRMLAIEHRTSQKVHLTLIVESVKCVPDKDRDYYTITFQLGCVNGITPVPIMISMSSRARNTNGEAFKERAWQQKEITNGKKKSRKLPVMWKRRFRTLTELTRSDHGGHFEIEH
jgi:hypothetical protein